MSKQFEAPNEYFQYFFLILKIMASKFSVSLKNLN